jgi:hypothetical protein
MTAKPTSGRFAAEKLQESCENSKLKMFVIWYLRRIIFAGQTFASDNIESRDCKKNTPILQNPFRFAPASERPKIHNANTSIENHPGIMDIACKTTSATANTNIKTIIACFLLRPKQSIKETDTAKQAKKDNNKITGKFLPNSEQGTHREPFL